VATDSDQIEYTVRNFGFKKVIIYRRLVKIAQDKSTTESVMLEYLATHSLPDEATFTLMQATSPLTNEKDLD
jgi:CMP-N-acetylneuraminic acid synthetase